MASDIVVQDINHAEIHRFGDDADETLFKLCTEQPETSLVRGISRYGDTMFNRYQLGLILDQIEGIEVRTDAERQAIDLLRLASSIALRANGYLLFVGD
ncbi:hypothetical protein U3653_09385 [Nocardia sp. CDC186]|uniref:Uncharacterized protein n=1 Tax=Nocardia implantans TaxID=3108168 RepID=A0ABU6AS10_9NOCA|nr:MULTISPECIES: hypothetical protein [unclassified Nocardia]MBF6191673.1 hypothetical protein [Nocardia beijingensis]MEA3528019.1 hypothetical protein [Nocardia sp. CDC192]MEB3510229.1 hypothetical protein [Nocardia sp. CDC186]